MKRIIYLLLIVSGLNAYGQGYDYPIKPGTEEYKSLKSHKDIVDNFQIPDIVIEQMTTDELLEAYIHYPLLFDAFAFSNLETGLEKVSKKFNAYNKLQNRIDISDKVKEKLLEIDFEKSYKKDSINNEDSELIRYSLFELFASQDLILDKISQKDLVKIVKKCYKSYSIKNDKGLLVKKTSPYLSIKILDKLDNDIWESNKKNFKAFDKYYSDVFSPNTEELDSLMNFIVTLKFD